MEEKQLLDQEKTASSPVTTRPSWRERTLINELCTKHHGSPFQTSGPESVDGPATTRALEPSSLLGQDQSQESVSPLARPLQADEPLASPMPIEPPINIENFEESAKNEGLKRSTRDKKIPPKLQDYLCNTIWHLLKSYSSFALPTSTAASSKSFHLLIDYLTCDKFFDPHKHLLAYLTAKIEPIWHFDVVEGGYTTRN